jgi:hypothetical protein
MVIQVLEIVTEEDEKKREKSWLCAANTSLVWHTGQSGGAPDSVRCARLAGGELAALAKKQRHTAIIHRTVRWCTRLSGEPTIASATIGRAIRGRRVACSNGRLGTPDCPVCTGQCLVRQLTPRTNSRMRQKRDPDNYSGCPVVHRTVRCTTRQKASLAFQVGLQRLLAALGL